MALPGKYKKTAALESSTLLHPPYFQMVSEALTSLKDRNGSSQPAIAKFLEDKYTKQLPPNYKKILSVQLKKFVKSQKLFKIKNSYKITSSTEKENEKKKKKKQPKGRCSGGSDEKNAGKMKMLCQLKTPEALKKKKGARGQGGLSNVRGSVTAGRMKRLSQVNTPEALKNKRTAAAVTSKTSTSKICKATVTTTLS